MYDGDLWKGEAQVVRHADKAMLVEHEGEEGWVPYSQIDEDSELQEDSALWAEGEIVIPLWLAAKNGWA